MLACVNPTAVETMDVSGVYRVARELVSSRKRSRALFKRVSRSGLDRHLAHEIPDCDSGSTAEVPGVALVVNPSNCLVLITSE